MASRVKTAPTTKHTCTNSDEDDLELRDLNSGINAADNPPDTMMFIITSGIVTAKIAKSDLNDVPKVEARHDSRINPAALPSNNPRDRIIPALNTAFFSASGEVNLGMSL